MGTYTQILYQIVFGTKRHEHTMTKAGRDTLFQYIAGLLKNKKCHLYQINGVENHLHILTHLHPSIALADLVKDVKLSSSKFIRKQQLFMHFDGWQDGYAAFTYSQDRKEILINYIRNQEAHHQKKAFREELIELLKENEVEFEEMYQL